MSDRIGSIVAHYDPRISSKRANFDVLDWSDAASQRARFRVLAENVNLEGKAVLDVGCGLGDLLAYLKQQNIPIAYTGVDIVEGMVEAAKQQHTDGHFVCGDIFSEEILLPGSFDVVFCSGTFNLNLGNNLTFLPKAISRMLLLSREYLVFNCLHKRMATETERYFYYDPIEVRKMLEPFGCELRILDDYLPNDFTAICRK